MPYRVDVRKAGDDAFDRLVELGAIDAEDSGDGGIAALMPDDVRPEQVSWCSRAFRRLSKRTMPSLTAGWECGGCE